MSASGPRYHIPFPTAFLSLNTKPSKTNADGVVVASPETSTAHSFLSNRSVVPRHSSISSESSTSSATSIPSSPPAQIIESPTLKAALPTFLALNSKHTAPPTSVKDAGDKTPFLSNKA
ncbi:hypothetical protein K505DRAFT_43881 [Melanomma pulvis-pyrius CBS 109.77]|uniref:Uncharacterized protein n=1 Tax=Melanomma pulvis-pyrius CBS 109.77 TaxID=1314802 RepID=A0A6A6XUW7_9PLEO|nr:hypothetical protein K505DRAFT_43881 [Melanomma pulvis-pyrius CBS 109.77]